MVENGQNTQVKGLVGKGPSQTRIEDSAMDPSAHLVYGQQQLGLFNTHVGDYGMMPFYIFDGISMERS
ncbi:MAG: hypothetical protein ACI8T1_005246 [Verrucomicrobiales bacterium]